MPKLGSVGRPAVLRVRSMEKAKEVMALCQERGWKVVVGIEPEEPEDLRDLERLLAPPAPVQAKTQPGRNDPCPCGSGRKFKRCCGA